MVFHRQSRENTKFSAHKKPVDGNAVRKICNFSQRLAFPCMASARGGKRTIAQNIAQIDGVKFYAFDGECTGNGVEFLQFNS